MIYYLIIPGQTEQDLTDHNIIGEVSGKTFHTGVAYSVLSKLIKNNNISILDKLIIKDSSNKIWNLDSFFKKIESYHIITY